jgi:uncharacterized protein (TIGR00369 family)
MSSEHFRKLERMYLGANFNTMIYDTTTICIEEGKAEIGLVVSDKFHHALGAMHGSVYFKMLDDASFFAVNSIVEDHFVLTTSFNVNFTRPVSEGRIRAYGEVRFQSSKLFTATATLLNEEGTELAFGTGNFTKSRVELSEDIGYV